MRTPHFSCLLVFSFVAVMLNACSSPDIESAADTRDETALLNRWLDEQYELELAFSPVQKTLLGRKDDYDRYDDLSEQAAEEFLRWSAESADELIAGFNYASLSPEAKTSYDLWIYQHAQRAAAHEFRRRHYVFHQLDGPHTDFPQFMINFHRVDTDADMLAYIARIAEGSRAVGQALERATQNALEGVHAPAFSYEAIAKQSQDVITGRPFTGDAADTTAPTSPLWADASTKIDALRENGIIDSSRAEYLRKEVEAALLSHMRPVYEALIAWAESELPISEPVATGVWRLPDGPDYYKERLAYQTTTTMTAEEIHELGLREVERILSEMDGIREQVGFTGTLSEFFAFVRTDEQFVFANTDAGRQSYIDTATAHLENIKAVLPEFFGLLPKADLVVRRVEAFREEPGAPQHYFPGTPDGSRPGIYYAHLIDMNQMPIPDLETVAYHEGLPGHHMQISIAQELSGIPTFRTQVGFTAYIEGWALYAESLAEEMGAFENPYSRFGRLSAEIWRAIRLVVDTGLHAKGWSEAEAVEYFTNNSAVSEGQIRAEVQRYIVMPGQATAYKIGMLKIQELRARAQAELGNDFDIRQFHDVILGGGALPLSILERRVDDWITATVRAAA